MFCFQEALSDHAATEETHPGNKHTAMQQQKLVQTNLRDGWLYPVVPSSLTSLQCFTLVTDRTDSNIISNMMLIY